MMIRLVEPHRARVVLGAVLILILSSDLAAQTGPDLLIREWKKGQFIDVNGGVTFLDKGHTDDASEFQLTFYESQGRLRLYPLIPQFPEMRADPRFGYDITYLDVDTNDPGLPDKLVDTSVAFGMGIADVEGWLAGLTVGVGYAAAGAFDDGNAWYGKADLAIGKQLDESTSVGFVLDYDGNRTFMPDIPLPGFEYRKRIDDRLLLAVGFPFTSVEWKPMERLKIDAKYVFPDDADLRVDYGLIDSLGVFASYAARLEAFHFDDLPTGSDRLIFLQRRVEAGVRWSPMTDANLIVAGGYAFSQEFNVGFDTRDQDRVAEPSDEPYVRFGFEFRY
jgi:hypothetical protein